RHHFRMGKVLGNGAFRPALGPAAAFTPSEVAQAYNFPTGVNGEGQCVALLEFGGGLKPAELQDYFKKLGVQPIPQVEAVSVLGGGNKPTGNPNSADGEVNLDIEVVGSVAPGAKIGVYFAPNSDRGFVTAILAAVHDQQRKPSIISISWGEA